MSPIHSLVQTTLFCLLVVFSQVASSAERTVPIIYSTDLYHPPTDPDDHFDTAVLFAMKEFDIRCVILDNGLGRQVEPGVKAEFKHRIGRPALEQLMQITGRKVNYAPAAEPYQVKPSFLHLARAPAAVPFGLNRARTSDIVRLKPLNATSSPCERPQGRAAPSPPAGVKQTWGGTAFP